MLTLAMDLGIHNYLVNKQSGGQTDGETNGVIDGEIDAVANSKELAKATGAGPVLMQRIMRNLAALGHVEEVDTNAYRANKFSKAFTTTAGVAGFRCA